MPSSVSSLLLRVGAKSHTGLVRNENQDRMSRVSTPLGEVFLVADGVGGHRGGATAAMMTVEGLSQYLQAATANETPQAALQQAAQRTNAEIYQRSYSGDPTVAGMGSTVVLALVSDQHLLIGHAGDSRAYLFREGQLQRLTRDHSVIQAMIDHKLLTEEEARDHPEAHVIERAFGQTADIKLELSELLALQPGDGVLLCSDGLCGYVDDAAITDVLNIPAEPQRIADELVGLALAAGGADNVTVQFLQFSSPHGTVTNPPQQDAAPSAKEGKSRRRLVLAILLVSTFLLGMLAMAATGRLRAWFERQRNPAVLSSPMPPPAAEGEKKAVPKPSAPPAQSQPGDAPAPRP